MSTFMLTLPNHDADFSLEKVWAFKEKEGVARIFSVVRYDSGCQFQDLVSYELADDEAKTPRFVRVIESAGHVVHRITGGLTTPQQAVALTDRMREAELHIEIWSLTMRLPGDRAATDAPVNLSAGLCIPKAIGVVKDAGALALHARAVLFAAAKEFGIEVAAPTLCGLVGDDLGARREKKLGQRLRLVGYGNHDRERKDQGEHRSSTRD